MAASREAARLSGPTFRRVFQVDQEPSARREAYGGEFGQRCLLARRLVEAGVRFVEVAHNLNFVNGTGWDTHNQGQLQQHGLIIELDHALAALLDDLERVGKLDSTLVVVATEFGRPPEFDAGGGRGHQSTAFSAVLAGGGLKTGQVIGTTDDLARTIVDQPVSVPDFHATIHSALGIQSRQGTPHPGRPPGADHRSRPIPRRAVLIIPVSRSLIPRASFWSDPRGADPERHGPGSSHPPIAPVTSSAEVDRPPSRAESVSLDPSWRPRWASHQGRHEGSPRRPC